MTLSRGSRVLLLMAAAVSAALTVAVAGVVVFASVAADRVRPLKPPAIDHLRNGDLIFRSGISRDSHLIKAFDPGASYSHVGLIDLRDGNAYVIHIEPGETVDDSTIKREPLDEFLAPRKADGFAVFHVVPADDARARDAIQVALGYASRRVVFDRDFDLETRDTMYCSELVWRAYLESGLDLLDGDFGPVPTLRGGRLIRVSGLTHSPHTALAATAGSTE